MARRTSFRLPGLTTWVENIKNELSQETAREIVKDLQYLGPWYSGEFGKNWVVRAGQTSIGATKKRPNSFNFLNPDADTPNSKPLDDEGKPSRSAMPGPAGGVPRPKGRKSIFYTIGNRMEYRNIALDLVPGRFDKNKRNTAPQDWYVLYAEGGLLRKRLEQSTQRVANLPKISGFKGTGTIRGELGL